MKDNQINRLHSRYRLFVTKSSFYRMQAYCGKSYNVIPTGMIANCKHIPIEVWARTKELSSLEIRAIKSLIRSYGGYQFVPKEMLDLRFNKTLYKVTTINKEK